MLLVTRPLPIADATARRLKRLGYKSVIAPQIKAHFRAPRTVDTDDVQAVIVTSPQAAQALKTWKNLRHLSAIAVGDKTASLLKKSGFKNVNVRSADGDARDLIRLIKSICRKTTGALLLAGAPTTGRKLAVDLQNLGYTARRISVYETGAIKTLPLAAQQFLQNKKSAKGEWGILFYSPRTARAFVEAVQKARLTPCLKRLNAYCISAVVAKSAQKLPWRHVHIALRPTEDALLALLPKPRT
jgi:uroporphyrinogen-III synthase